MSAKQIPEKCRLCAKLQAKQALQMHGLEGAGIHQFAPVGGRTHVTATAAIRHGTSSTA